MAFRPSRPTLHRRHPIRLSTGVAIACLLSACANPGNREAAKPKFYGPTRTAAAPVQQQPQRPADPLQAAVAYWAEEHRKNPGDARAATNYALNLKAMGADARARQVLTAAHERHPKDPRIASELGRLTLAADDPKAALRLLTVAEQGTPKPDWRLLSAKGTAHAKLGEASEAQRYYRAALAQKPDSLPTLNNLALSYALDGKATEAEALLRRVVAQGGDSQRVRQNLALVLGLQGKFSEARQVAKADMPAEIVTANIDFLRNMVRRQPVEVAAASEAEVPAPAPRVAAAGSTRPLERWAASSAVAAAPPPVRRPSVPRPPERRPEPAAAERQIAAAMPAPPPPTRKPGAPGMAGDALPWQAGGARPVRTVAVPARKQAEAGDEKALTVAASSAFQPLPWQSQAPAAAPPRPGRATPRAGAETSAPTPQASEWSAKVAEEPTPLRPAGR